MRRFFFLSVIAVASLMLFSGCEKENHTKGPKIETLSANNAGLCIVSLTGRVSGLVDMASDFECGIEYSTDASFPEDKTTRLKSDEKYSELPYSVTVANVTSGQKYYYRAYYISQLIISYGEVKDFTFSWIIPEAVDLGLSVKWASWNVGANCPWEYGDYYAWGETGIKSTYSITTYKWCNGSFNTQTKYNNSSNYGTVDNNTVLDADDDVAHVKWGGSWRMPTLAELDELRNNCTWKWYDSGNTEFNGVAGYKVTGNKSGYTDRSIFLPAAGVRNGTSLDNVGSIGLYWSSSLFKGDPMCAWALSSYSGYDNTYNVTRDRGLSVRPVCP
ncbi:MAG: hypothetical protein J6P66_02725 [Bacteroidaceae bacterium]|nr:hypothetical protein [Bacteroidaceae bacterium]